MDTDYCQAGTALLQISTVLYQCWLIASYGVNNFSSFGYIMRIMPVQVWSQPKCADNAWRHIQRHSGAHLTTCSVKGGDSKALSTHGIWHIAGFVPLFKWWLWGGFYINVAYGSVTQKESPRQRKIGSLNSVFSILWEYGLILRWENKRPQSGDHDVCLISLAVDV